ncbi:MAG: CheR family methyltransferase [Flavitalea sp.]
MPEEILNYLQEPSQQQIESIDESRLDEIFRLISAEDGNDFHYYKLPTITRRIIRRMVQKEALTIDEYLDLLRNDPEECRQLGKEFLIGVTKFFRDNEAFDILEKEVLTKLINEKTNGDTIKIWVCACSTGEEAYSLAISVDNLLSELEKDIEVKIFATDMDQASIDLASRGCYPLSIEKDIPGGLLRKYFLKKGNNYQIVPSIRKQIVFAKHNVLKDPPFINNDLVTCRNMLIYMSPLLQQKVMSVLMYGVTLNKYLFLGPSENSNLVKDNVQDVNAKWKIYQKIKDTKLTSQYIPDLSEKRLNRTDKRYQTQREEQRPKTLWDDLKEALNEDLNFAAFYIDQSFNIKDTAGSYGKFLTLPKKNLQLNLLAMVPTELYLLLSSEIRKSVKENQTANLKNLKYRRGDLVYSWHVLIKPSAPHTLVVITETEVVQADSESAPAENDGSTASNEYVRNLEHELSDTKDNLQYAIEDLETTNEELQSSNEELLSANEELQSSNEELQSLNEELHTLNTEHQLKIKELIELNDDLNNYFRSIDVGQVFLDKQLKIRKFNSAATATINLIESDTGRPIFHISNNIRYDGFMNDLETVLRSNEVIEKEVGLANGKNVLMRIMPYLTRDKVNSGVVISIVDVTLITNLNNMIRAVLNSNPGMILSFEAVRRNGTIEDFKLIVANPAAEMFLPVDTEANGLSLRKELPMLNDLFDRFVELVQKDSIIDTDIYLESEQKWFNLIAAKMMDGIVTTFTDITAKKTSEEKLRKNYVELITAKDNLKAANEQLESKVSERTKALSQSEERFRLVTRATNDALWDWDFVKTTLWWSESFFILFGYEKGEDVYNRKFWLGKIHPDDRKRVNMGLHETINSSNAQWSQEYRFQKADGTYAHILDRGYVLHDEFGTPYRMLGSMFDLTRVKAAEEQAANSIAQRKFLAESMPLIVWTADKDGNVNFANRYYETYTGSSYRDALGEGWKQLVHAEDLEPLESKLKDSIALKRDFGQEVRLLHRSGEYRWNMLRTKVSVDPEDQLLDLVITIVDIHEHRVMNELLEKKVSERTSKLNEINRALEISNNDLLQFASVASHDLQEPVRKIQMFSKLITDKYDSELNDSAKNYLSKIIHASARMKLLITDVLNYSKLSASDNNHESTDLNKLVGDTLEDFEIMIREKGAEVNVGQLPVLDVIPGQLRQVFQNLISNALKFSRPELKPRIDIHAELVSTNRFDATATPDGSYCRIVVEDNGIGFDEQFSKEIFNLFKRLHSKDSFEGTGIGLAITQKIIEKHNGFIKADSSEGSGARFIIILPVSQDEPNDIQKHADAKTQSHIS